MWSPQEAESQVSRGQSRPCGYYSTILPAVRALAVLGLKEQ